MAFPIGPSSAGASSAPSSTASWRPLLSLALSTALPVLLLGSGLYLSGLLPRLLVLLALALVSAVVGAAMLWRQLGSTAPGTAAAPPRESAVGAPPREPAAGSNREEIESLMESFSGVLVTIEQQAAELNQYAVRLDNAYKEIETSNARLKE
ncbi:MAG TPA: hypothetical protein VEL75_03320, partial [Candidatus Methylomirabilis sp.]|nr:hypothetical protein [Candidatus Methylomirabilis sp.]